MLMQPLVQGRASVLENFQRLRELFVVGPDG